MSDFDRVANAILSLGSPDGADLALAASRIKRIDASDEAYEQFREWGFDAWDKDNGEIYVACNESPTQPAYVLDTESAMRAEREISDPDAGLQSGLIVTTGCDKTGHRRIDAETHRKSQTLASIRENPRMEDQIFSGSKPAPKATGDELTPPVEFPAHLFPKSKWTGNQHEFNLCRWIKARFPNLSLPQELELVAQWFAQCDPRTIEGKDIEGIEVEYIRSEPKFIDGITHIHEANNMIQFDVTVPPEISALCIRQRAWRTALVIKELCANAPDGTVSLSARQAGVITDREWSQSASILSLLCKSRILECVSRGHTAKKFADGTSTGPKASRYRYIWQSEPNPSPAAEVEPVDPATMPLTDAQKIAKAAERAQGRVADEDLALDLLTQDCEEAQALSVIANMRRAGIGNPGAYIQGAIDQSDDRGDAVMSIIERNSDLDGLE